MNPRKRVVCGWYYLAFVSSIAWSAIGFGLDFVVCLSAGAKAKERPRIPILEYHDGWVCVNKPSGITVHRGNGTPKHTAVLTSRVKRQLARKVFPVHRLDHRTSGAMIFAFDSETAGILHDAAIRKGRKQYIALVRGEWNPQNTTTTPTTTTTDSSDTNNDNHADSLIEHNPSTPPSVVFVDKPLEVKGITKEALTKFTLLGTTAGTTSTQDRCSLLLCEPLTGRTHQIRRHAYAMGHPIIGDSQHGDNAFNRWWRKHRKLKLNRLGLHCWTIDFELDGSLQNCLAPLPKNLRAVLEDLPLWETALQKQPRLALEPVDMVGGTHGRGYHKRKGKQQNHQNHDTKE